MSEIARRSQHQALGERVKAVVDAYGTGDTAAALALLDALPEALRPFVDLTSSRAVTAGDVLDQWSNDGPVVRVPTGIVELDLLCSGGLKVPRAVVIVGAPGAGKTFLEITIANTMARTPTGPCVGILAVDERPGDVMTRLVQMAGFSRADAERRDPDVIARMREALAGVRVRLYGGTCTIKQAADDLASWAASEERRPVLFADSLQAVHPAKREKDRDLSEREKVERNVDAMTEACEKHKMLVIATSEANRASYRSKKSADETDAKAAGAESRAIEYGAETQLMLRTPEGHPGVIHVEVAKNRGDISERAFWLKLDREKHTLTECDEPDTDPSAVSPKSQRVQKVKLAQVHQDAKALTDVATDSPGLSVRKLYAATGARGLGIGRDRFDAALSLLRDGFGGKHLVNRATGQACEWHVEDIPPPSNGANGASEAASDASF